MPTAPNRYDFVVDIEGNQLVRAFNSRKAAPPPQFLVGESQMPVSVRFVKPSTGSDPDLPWTELSTTGHQAQMSIGIPGGNPTAGTWELTYGSPSNTTINLAYNASAANVQAELNKLTTIQNDGNVTVVSPSTGFYRITWNSKGARSLLSADTTALYPTVTKDIREAIAGSGSQREVQVVDIKQAKAVTLGMDTLLPSAAVTITTVRTGNSTTGVSEIQKVDLSDPEPYAGSYTLTTNQSSGVTNTSGAIAFNASTAALQTAITNTNYATFNNKITVTGGFPEYTVEYDATLGDVGALTADVTLLTVPTGFRGFLNTNIVTMKELLGGAASKTAKVEFRVGNVTATPTNSWTPVQAPCTVFDEILFGTEPTA